MPRVTRPRSDACHYAAADDGAGPAAGTATMVRETQRERELFFPTFFFLSRRFFFHVFSFF